MNTCRFDGALLILRLNWPFYVIAAAVGLVWPPLAYSRIGTDAVELIGWIVWMATVWWAAASIAVSYWVYDASKLRTWKWIEELMPRAPRRWINIHAGLDQSTPALKALFRNSDGVSLDTFDGNRMTEPAIRRARRLSAHDAVPAKHSSLPIQDGRVDAVFLFFAAHELRARSSRDELFREIARVLTSEGRLILVEHQRDGMNMAAFGPGAWHFLPRAEWLRLFRHGELNIDSELRITPFVRVWSASKRVQ